ncbi:ABC transporter ATP-binding protein [Dehalococcoidales bacterium]|nr:ABC transporter ATP-binding protein [Dehalococcoidales bacterium]
MGVLLEVKDLKTYFFTDAGVVRAVDGISCYLKEGETIGLAGESGCGKSVSALSVMRLIHPPGRIVGGEIIFEGKNLLMVNGEEMRHVRGGKIAMIFQEPMTSLNPVLTIGHQISEALEIHLGMDKQDARKRSKELLQLVAIPDAERRLNDYPHQFSGGMRQRVMIAIALSCNPKLLIADEPTTAVDVTIQAQLLEIMKEMTGKFGTSLILITHNLGVIARYAQRVYIMYAGKIVETGLASDVYRAPRHPYTMGLLASVPRLDTSSQTRLTPISGEPPDMIHLPPGCSFRPRCAYAMERCAQEAPPLKPVAEKHYAACWVEVGG